VSAQLKKIVSHPNWANGENLLPNLRELQFQVVSRRDESFFQFGACSIRHGQGPAVYLAIGQQR
jgi:hypothetical protein